MPYRIKRKKSIQKNVRRIASEQIEKAIAELNDEQLDRHEVVHQVRKRCKKLRGLIRLVRDEFNDYQFENRFFRDAARELSFVRDSQSMVECFDDLMEHYRDQVDEQSFLPIRKVLAERRLKLADRTEVVNRKLDHFLTQIREARERVDSWKIGDDGWDAVEKGLSKTYRRGRKALEEACEDPTTENFHEWRKRVKYYWYHNRLLRSLWPEMMKAQRHAADELSDYLGDDHDLAVLRQNLLDDPESFGDRDSLQALMGLIDRRRAELQTRAYPVGKCLFAETSDEMTSRMRVYWKVWKSKKDFTPKLSEPLTTAS